jgi:hypothetical protein
MCIVMTFAGWITTIGMIGFCALNESSKLPTIPKGLAASLENPPPSFYSQQRTKKVCNGMGLSASTPSLSVSC